MVGQGGRSGLAPLGLPGGDRASRQGDRDGGQGGGRDGGGRVGRAATFARRLWQRADRGARLCGAPETTEAFAKARGSRTGEKDAPNGWRPITALWAGSIVRGELPAMRTHAAAFLRDIEARPESPEAGVAHRAAGITRWFAGEYAEAREHFERALALFQPGRDDDLAFRFGHDAGVAAMIYLALTLWPLGEVERAVSLGGRAQARIAGLGHVGTHAFGKFYAAMFELMRGDYARAAPNAIELARVGREHDLPMWGALRGLSRGLGGG